MRKSVPGSLARRANEKPARFQTGITLKRPRNIDLVQIIVVESRGVISGRFQDVWPGSWFTKPLEQQILSDHLFVRKNPRLAPVEVREQVVATRAGMADVANAFRCTTVHPPWPPAGWLQTYGSMQVAGG